MLLQTLEVAFDRLPNVCGRFSARSALGNTTGQSGARRHEHAVLVLFQENAILHYPALYQGGAATPWTELVRSYLNEHADRFAISPE